VIAVRFAAAGERTQVAGQQLLLFQCREMLASGISVQ